MMQVETTRLSRGESVGRALAPHTNAFGLYQSLMWFFFFYIPVLSPLVELYLVIILQFLNYNLLLYIIVDKTKQYVINTLIH